LLIRLSTLNPAHQPGVQKASFRGAALLALAAHAYGTARLLDA
jgi:hypothetical protein